MIDDALKFVRRESRRHATYDAFIIDPPKFGRGPKNEVWKIYKDLPILLNECQKLFSDKMLFINLTCYAIRITPLSLRYVLEERLAGRGGSIEQRELALREQSSDRLLPQAVCARWGV
jgi:23S rRNA (cytosine1962-C5)-methyltransferase